MGTPNHPPGQETAVPLPRFAFLSKVWPSLCAIASGVALSFCYPRWNHGGLVWLALAPLLVALWFSRPQSITLRGPAKRLRSSGAWRGFRLGWISGFSFFCLNLSWLLQLEKITGSVVPGLLGVVSLSAYLGIFFGLWGAFAATVGRIRQDRLFAGPKPATSPFETLFASSGESLRAASLCAAAWCGQEWLRGWLFTGFGWNGLGVALHENLILIQICDIVGVTGLSFLIVFCLCIAVATIRRLMLEVGTGRPRPHLDFAAAISLLIAVFFYGLDRRPTLGSPRPDSADTTDLRVLLVQPFTPQLHKFDPDSHADDIYQTLAAYSIPAPQYDLVVWPESALPYVYFTRQNQDNLDPILAGGDFSLLLGTNHIDLESESFFNSAVLVRGDLLNSPQFYHKIHLVPFGEYIPLRPVFGWVKRWLPGSDFSRGTSSDPLVLDSPKVNLSPLICFEDTIGRVARHAVRSGSPQLLVNITNDGWFGISAEPEQHLANAVFRCVELRRPMVRAANTGVTCAIDASGSFLDPADPTLARRRIFADPDSGSTFISGTFAAQITLENDPPITFYAKYGDAFSISLGLIALAATALAFFRRRSG